MSITLNHSDFQCLQDQLVELKTKNYELAEKNRRSQADFEAAKARICSLQMKLEEQERDFQITSTTLRREIETVSGSCDTAKGNKDDDYKAKYKKLLHKAKEIQQRNEKLPEIVQQLDIQNKNLNERILKLEGENLKLKEINNDHLRQSDILQKEYQDKLNNIIKQQEADLNNERQQHNNSLNELIIERDTLKNELDRLNGEIKNLDQRLESQSEERRIHERKGLQIVKELKRQLAIEKNRTDTLQKRLENLLSEQSTGPSGPDLENRSRLSNSSSTNGNSSSNGNGSRLNQDTNSVGSWSFVPVKTRVGDNVLNETLSLCSIDSEDRETVQQPFDNTSEDSMQHVASIESASKLDQSSSNVSITSSKQPSSSNLMQGQISDLRKKLNSPSYIIGHSTSDGTLAEEQAALVERIARMQQDKWMLEEKLSYMEQANASLYEDLANKSEIIRHYFMDQAQRAASLSSETIGSPKNYCSNLNPPSNRHSVFTHNVNHILSEKPSFKKVVDFLKERSQLSLTESESVSREATKKMQLMLEETMIKCLKLQENLDHVTSELNKLKTSE